ncbi:MAG: hypothetical protein IJ649_08190 [Oscillospiraceae bacterium]|nr:hypothetical protein [Oscillospiraceae bacterium]
MKRTTMALLTGILIGAAAFSGGAAYAVGVIAERSSNTIYVDGRRVELEAYMINGSNYVKLRDVGKAVGFNVYWDGTVQIEKDAPYTGKTPESTVTTSTNQANPVVTLPTDGSKYTPQVGDLIPCGDGTLYEVRDVSRFENNAAAPGPLPDLPEPTCDWSLFPTLELPAPEVRHYVSDAGDNLFVRNVFETRRMQYTLYNAIGRIPESWRDGKPLAKVFLTIPAEYEAYTPVFWPWRAVEVEKHVANIPRGRFRCEAWDYYKDHTFLETRYYICTV